MKAHIKNDTLVIEIPAINIVHGCAAQRIKITDREAMLKHFAEHILSDETTGEDLEINAVLDGIAARAVESAEPWCEDIDAAEDDSNDSMARTMPR